MNYTKNHHLPQWEETDRIMRTDFNEAMAGIEEGLDEANASAASALDAAEARALARLRRLGYDLCQTAARSAAAGASLGHAKGLVYNGLATEAERAKISGILLPRKKPGGQLGPQTGLTLEELNASVYRRQSGMSENVSDITPASVCFRTEHRGTITRLDVWFQHKYILTAEPTVQIRLYDLEAEAYTFTSAEMTVSGMGGAVISPRSLEPAVPLEAGKNYRMELTITKTSGFSGPFGFGVEDGAVLTGAVEAQPFTGGTVSESLALEIPACMALAVVHYSGGGSVSSVKVGNQTMAVKATRQTVSARGDACTEREYCLEGDWSGSVPLTAAFSSPSKDMDIYDVAWYLI